MNRGCQRIETIKNPKSEIKRGLRGLNKDLENLSEIKQRLIPKPVTDYINGRPSENRGKVEEKHSNDSTRRQYVELFLSTAMANESAQPDR